VADELAKVCDHEICVTVLGHVQRGGSPSPFDRILGTRFGAAAVRLIAEGGLSRMVALRSQQIVSIPLEEAIYHCCGTGASYGSCPWTAT
jgi:6-phosphofructokinase